MDLDVPVPAGPLLSLTTAVIRHQDHLLPLIRSYQYIGRKRIRISMAALARMEINGCYFVVENRHRPECLSPFGGVFKYYPTANSFLDGIGFDKEKKSSRDSDLKNDLRGYIHAGKFGAFMAWFKGRTHREQSDCLSRELREEMTEAGVPANLRQRFVCLQFNLIRTVHEGPRGHDGLEYASFRYFEIYSPVQVEGLSSALMELCDWSKQRRRKVHVVERGEIDGLRTSENLAISGSTKYFFSDRWHGFEPAGL